MTFIRWPWKNYECLLRSVSAGSYLWVVLRENLIISISEVAGVPNVFCNAGRNPNLICFAIVVAEKCPEARSGHQRGG
jgi:hypothetical protein